jgi:hypothetical protein
VPTLKLARHCIINSKNLSVIIYCWCIFMCFSSYSISKEHVHLLVYVCVGGIFLRTRQRACLRTSVGTHCSNGNRSWLEHIVTTMGTKDIVRTHCHNNGKKSWLEHIVTTMGTGHC